MAPPLEPPSPEPSPRTAASAAAVFTVRYHRKRMLALAATCCALWLLAQYPAEGSALGWSDLLLPVLAVGPLASVCFAFAPFSAPYLLFNTNERTFHGPGGTWFARTHPRPERAGVSYAARGKWICEISARGERRLFHGWWAHPADWATITTLLEEKEPAPPLPPDWIAVVTAPTGTPVSFGINRKRFLWVFLIGLAGSAATWLAFPVLLDGPDFLRILAFAATAPLTIGLATLIFNAVYTYGAGGFVVKSRLTGTSVFPASGWHLEYSARLGNLYHVRADGKRRIVVPQWAVDPQGWKHFTDLLQERVR